MNMENNKPENPFAFPVDTQFQSPYSEGMTLRDYFAANENVKDDMNQYVKASLEIIVGRVQPEDLIDRIKWFAEAESALQYIKADAMLKARSNP